MGHIVRKSYLLRTKLDTKENQMKKRKGEFCDTENYFQMY